MYEILGLKHVFSTFQETVWSHLKCDGYATYETGFNLEANGCNNRTGQMGVNLQMGVTIEQYRARIGCHDIKNTYTSIQDNESPFLSERFLIKGWCYFIYTCSWWLCYYHLTGCRSNGHFDYNSFSHSPTVVDIQFPPLQISSYRSPPEGPSFIIYGNALHFTTNSTFDTIVICQQKISTTKNFLISKIYNENRTTFATFNLVTSSTLVQSEQHISDSVDTWTPGVRIFYSLREYHYTIFYPLLGWKLKLFIIWRENYSIEIYFFKDVEIRIEISTKRLVYCRNIIIYDWITVDLFLTTFARNAS